MNDVRLVPRWLQRDRVEEERREQVSGLRSITILDDLNGLKLKLEMTVRRLESMVSNSDETQGNK